jgi:hypothetical protein
MRTSLGFRRHLVRAFRPLVRCFLLKQSPHYHAGQPGWFTVVMQGIKMLKGKPAKVKVG